MLANTFFRIMRSIKSLFEDNIKHVRVISLLISSLSIPKHQLHVHENTYKITTFLHENTTLNHFSNRRNIR